MSDTRSEDLKKQLEQLQKKYDALNAVAKLHDNGDVQVHVNGFDMRWHIAEGIFTFAGLPAPMMWADTTLAGLMSGVQAMVGTERFSLALQNEGRKSCEEDWKVISAQKNFEDGFRAIAVVAGLAGWGRWELVTLNRTEQQAIFRVYQGWEGLYQKALNVCWGSGMVAGKFAGYCMKLFDVSCWAEQTRFIAKGDDWDEFLVKPSDRTVETELEILVQSNAATHEDMRNALKRLEDEVRQREQIEAELQTKIRTIESQRVMISELSTPIISVWDDILVLPLVGKLDTTRSIRVTEKLLNRVHDARARCVIIDITGLDIVDTNTANYLVRMFQSARMLGVHAVLTGISPQIAQSLVNLGVRMKDLPTLRNLKEALKSCINYLEET